MKVKAICISASVLLLAGFVSCQREQMGPNGNEREVKAQFVFNISTLRGNQTKQSAEQSQATVTTFRGIRDARLMTIARGDTYDGKILVTDRDADHVYDFSNVVRAGQISTSSSSRILEMSLPNKTNTLVFYGRGVKGSADTDNGFSQEDCYGNLSVYNVSGTKGETYFQLDKRLKDKELFYATEKLIAGILTLVMNTNLKGSNHKEIKGDAYPEGVAVTAGGNGNAYVYSLAADKYTLEDGGYPQISWSSYVNEGKKSPVETTHALYPLEEKLANLYKEMTTILSTNNDELRAGSGEATIRMILDLWSVINSVRCAESTCKADAVAKFFAEQVNLHLEKYFAGTPTGDGKSVSATSFKSIDDIITNMTADAANWPSGLDDDVKITDDDITTLKASGVPSSATLLDHFPSYFNLPAGATYVVFDNTADQEYFSYPKVFNTVAMGTGGPYNAENYFYPAEILYFANSPLMASDKEHVENDYPKTTSAWNDHTSEDSFWNQKYEGEDKLIWADEHVTSSTRSVAMRYDIDYGVSMLETKIGYQTLELKDNRSAVLKEKDPSSLEGDQTIEVLETSFLFTGLVIGGQPESVGWNFLPRSVQVQTGGTSENPTYTDKYYDGFLYDKAIVSQSIPNSVTLTSGSNYTVVFDNYNATSNEQDKVNVALEFLNNTGKDFYGNHNLIRNGGHFYLVGTLNPAAASEGITWPTSGAVVPPYKEDGTSQEVTRVFVQDYKTTATFKFHENSLKHAYITVPDLRASSLTLGLSVDIVWQKGLVYNDVVLGGN